MGKKNKRPTQAEPLKQTEKLPRRTESPCDEGNEVPSWHVAKCSFDGLWSWADVSRDEARQVIERLSCFESMTWQEVRHRQNHPIPCVELSRDAQKELQRIGQDDVDELWSLRVTGPRRVWGVRVGSTLRVLWYDPKHEVYPVEKKR